MLYYSINIKKAINILKNKPFQGIEMEGREQIIYS